MNPTTVNFVPEQAPTRDTQKSFTLSIPPKTDIFASPALGYHFSAPILYTAIPTASFKSSRATICVPFDQPSPSSSTLQFDQAGLIFVLPHPSLLNPSLAHPGGSQTENKTGKHPKWIKAGIEVWEGKAWGSIVVRDKWCDWSLFELSASALGASAILGNKQCATITLEAERVGDALMIYVVEEGQERKPVRKVPWWFMDGETEEICWVGVYGARPDPFDRATGNFEVVFAGFEVEAEGK